MSRRRVSRALACLIVCVAASTVGAAPARADAVRSAQWYLGPLGISKAWSLTRGAGVKVAVIDNGVDGRTPELRGAIVGGRDFSGQGSANGEAAVASTGGTSHGTTVASVLAGRGTGPNSGVIGSAPRCSVLTASVATGLSTSVAPFTNAIRWAADQGAKVINLSLNIGSDSPAVISAVRYAESKDVVLVAGTGDEGINFVGIPAALPGVVAVAGVDRNLKADPNSDFGHGVAVAGPFATTPRTGIPVANRVGSPFGAHSLGSGVSYAASIVAGMVALIRAKFPSMNAANVINRLIRTAVSAGGATPNDHYGYGVPNVYRALTANIPSVSHNPLGSLAPSSGGSSGSSSPASSPASIPASTPASTQPAGASAAPGSKSGRGGAGIAVAALVVVMAGLIFWFVARSRRSGVMGGPAPRPPPPPAPPPPPRP